MIIKFNKKIYKARAVKLAIKEYQKLADFNLRQKGEHLEVRLTKIDKDLKGIIKDEFCNYVLYLMK